MMLRIFLAVVLLSSLALPVVGQMDSHPLRALQFQAAESNQATWAHWGNRKGVYSNWTNHSNRLIPVYSWGLDLKSVKAKQSVYRDEAKLKELYGQVPAGTLNPKAWYFDQTDIHHLNRAAFKSGKKKNIILMVFDGMDWQTIHAAATYRLGKNAYKGWRGRGLAFQDYRRDEDVTEFGFCVTSPHNGDTSTDVNAQIVTEPGTQRRGGYSHEFGGSVPWEPPADPAYLLGRRRNLPHAYTDSAASATSLNAGIKTYNGGINVDPEGRKVTTLAHEMQKEGYAIGVVTSVPISHATPAAVYAHNVTRNDYQDLTRDLIGIRSVTHRDKPLSGVDVLIGCGWGEMREDERDKQGQNFVPGNRFLTADDAKKIDVANGGKYVVAERQSGKRGGEVLANAASQAAENGNRLFGFFGSSGGHLPYQTADGQFDPTRGISGVDTYSEADVFENPSLAEMTNAALTVLAKNEKGFYLMVEAGDVDWANHNNNIDNSIGAVFSGEAAFTAITNWVDQNSNWDETCLIVTADHGHMFVLDDPRALTGELQPKEKAEFAKIMEAVQQKKEAARIAKEKAQQEKAAKAKAKASQEKPVGEQKQDGKN